MVKDENSTNDDIQANSYFSEKTEKVRCLFMSGKYSKINYFQTWDNHFSTLTIPVLSDPTILENSARYKAVAMTIPNPMNGTGRKIHLSFAGI